MYKHISHQQSQLELPLLWSESSVAAPVVESPKSEVVKEMVRYTCSVEDFKAQQELERDLMSGRGAWLYKQLEKQFAWERAQEKALNDFVAMQAAVNSHRLKI